MAQTSGTNQSNEASALTAAAAFAVVGFVAATALGFTGLAVGIIAAAFAIGRIYPLPTFNPRSVCSDGYQICHTFGEYGYAMFLALFLGIAVARLAGKNAGSDSVAHSASGLHQANR
jgi:hypothetical protein